MSARVLVAVLAVAAVGYLALGQRQLQHQLAQRRDERPPPERVIERIQVVTAPAAPPPIAPVPVVAEPPPAAEVDEGLALVERARAVRALSGEDLAALRRLQEQTSPADFEPVLSAIFVAINKGELTPTDELLHSLH